MDVNPYLVFILVTIVVGYGLDLLVSVLNIRSLDPQIPDEFRDVFDQEKYAKSQDYTKVVTKFSIIQDTFNITFTLAFILLGGFNKVDLIARSLGYGPIVTGLIFTGILLLIMTILGLPFSIYSTFVIEERFGFNKTTPKTFVLDMIKGIFLTAVIGGPLLAGILWFFQWAGTLAWLYCWMMSVVFTLVVQFLAPVVIMPLFNKFTPLPDCQLKDAILQYVKRQRFPIKGIYTMDGSKRSTKLNAFFTGFGRFRRIVFFDTLMDKLTPNEIVAVLAHETGHFKLKHIFKMMAVSIIHTGIMFYLLSFFMNNRRLFDAFGMEHISIYGGFVFFAFLYSPISKLISIALNWISRRHEYEADSFAVETIKNPEDLVSALKKLSVSNLSNLTPHPMHVFINYSHPPILKRIEAIKSKK